MKILDKRKIDGSLKIYNVGAVVLVMQYSIPSRELLAEWEENGAHITLILGGGFSAKGSSEQIRHLPEKVKVIDMRDVIKKNKVSARIRESIKEHGSKTKRTILISDHPNAMGAGRNKGLYMIIGITHKKEQLRPFYDQGANLVVHDPDCLEILQKSDKKADFVQTISGLFENKAAFESEFSDKIPVFFFDYDGTLSPIVKDPEQAHISNNMRSKLADLAKIYRVSIVSGRDKSDIEDFVQLEDMIYAGSHGFRISGPNNLYMEQENAKELLPRLDEMEQELRVVLEQKMKGVQVERKYFAIAIHFRNAPKGSFKKIINEVNRIIGDDADFKKGRGKKILEIKPSLDWHKGKALVWIMNHLNFLYPDKHMPVYVGDDLTDEDAFRTLADDGVGILVGKHSKLSAAKYHLENVDQVEKFLEYILETDKI